MQRAAGWLATVAVNVAEPTPDADVNVNAATSCLGSMQDAACCVVLDTVTGQSPALQQQRQQQ